jgi:hypothetical protein
MERAMSEDDPADRIARDLFALVGGWLPRAEWEAAYSVSYGQDGVAIRDLATRAVYQLRLKYLPPGHLEVELLERFDRLEPE